MHLPPPSSLKIQPKKIRRPKEPTRITVGQYLIKRLEKFQVRHIFGEKGDSILRLLKVIEYSSTCQFIEPILAKTAGTFADGYARVNLLGALLTTKENFENELSAFLRQSAENAPVVTILCTKDSKVSYKTERELFSYRTLADEAKYAFEKDCKKNFFVYSILDDPEQAAKKIDRTIDLALHYQKPVCFELPDDVVDSFIPQHETRLTTFIPSDPESLRDAYRHLKKILSTCTKPFICIGREVQTARSEDVVLQLAEKLDIPILAVPLGRAVVEETHPLFKGNFPQEEYLSDADFALYIGVDTESIKQTLSHVLFVDLEKIKHKVFLFEQDALIDSIRYPHVALYDLLAHLALANYPEKRGPLQVAKPHQNPLQVALNEKITKQRLLALLQEQLDYDQFELTLSSELLYDIRYPLRKNSVLSTLHTTHSFGLAAALGAQFALPEKRSLIILTETEFMRSFALLQLAVQYNLKLIVILLQEEKRPFAIDLKALPDLFDAGKIVSVATEDEFEKQLKKAALSLENFYLIKVKF